MDKKKNNLFKGEFNLNGQELTYFKKAKCQAEAKQLMILEMGIDLGMSRYRLNTQFFNGEKDNYRITRIFEKEN